MESLLCTEEWLMSPSAAHDNLRANELYTSNSSSNTSFYMTKEDCERAFAAFMDKEVAYMPELGYLKHVKSNSLIENVRLKTIYWLIKSQRRLNLSLETIFCAANYMDRFISLKQCESWKDWMFELLAIACLSVASKYNETIIHSFHVIQMEDLDYSFDSRLIQRMELTLFKALEWRLGPTTSYSYMELLRRTVDPHNKHLAQELTSIVTKLLLNALLDSKFVEFRPCVIAMSAIEYISKDLLSSSTNNAFVNHFRALIPKDQKDDLSKCYKMMDEYNLAAESIYSCPSSPVTVLATQHYNFSDFQVDLSLFKTKNVDLIFGTGKKRKRPEDQDQCLSEIIGRRIKNACSV